MRSSTSPRDTCHSTSLKTHHFSTSSTPSAMTLTRPTITLVPHRGTQNPHSLRDLYISNLQCLPGVHSVGIRAQTAHASVENLLRRSGFAGRLQWYLLDNPSIALLRPSKDKLCSHRQRSRHSEESVHIFYFGGFISVSLLLGTSLFLGVLIKLPVFANPDSLRNQCILILVLEIEIWVCKSCAGEGVFVLWVSIEIPGLANPDTLRNQWF